MPGMYDDLKPIPFTKVEEVKGRGARKHMMRRAMTMNEIKAANQDLLDEIAKYAGKLEYLLNKYGMTPEQLDEEMTPTPGRPAAPPDPPAQLGDTGGCVPQDPPQPATN